METTYLRIVVSNVIEAIEAQLPHQELRLQFGAFGGVLFQALVKW